MYQVLACGSNGQFQLGIGNDEDQSKLVAAKFEVAGEVATDLTIKPVEVICGGNHTLVRFISGEIYSCGDNTYGQCGHPQEQNIGIFKKIEGQWSNAACGWEFTILVDTQGKVFSCGRGLKGELGLGKGVDGQSLKMVMEFGPGTVKHIRAALNHTVVQLADGRLFGWGNCRKGQLGTQVTTGTKPESIIWLPRELSFEGLDPKLVRFIGVGRDFTAFYTDKYVEYGKEVVSAPSTQHERVIGLKAMWSSVHLLVGNDLDCAVRSQGNDSHGQRFPSGSGQRYRQIEIGSEHGLALAHDNTVWAWGWGEHGNCGEKANAEEFEDKLSTAAVSFGLNVIYNEAHPAVLLGCGCATSWVSIRKS